MDKVVSPTKVKSLVQISHLVTYLKWINQMNKVQSHVCPASEWQWKTGVTQYFFYLKEAAKETNPIKKEILLIAAKDCAAWNRRLDELTRKFYEQHPPKSKTHDKREKNLHVQPPAYCIPCSEINFLHQVYA